MKADHNRAEKPAGQAHEASISNAKRAIIFAIAAAATTRQKRHRVAPLHRTGEEYAHAMLRDSAGNAIML